MKKLITLTIFLGLLGSGSAFAAAVTSSSASLAIIIHT
jgi:hypothetical protein